MKPNHRVNLPARGTAARAWRPRSRAAGYAGRYVGRETIRTMTHRYERHPSSGLCLAMFLALGLACDRHATLKLGDVQEQRVSADVNGDGTADVVVLRKVVMDIIGVQEQYPSYKVTIEIRDGQSGKTLFQSPEYEESTIGIFVTEGDLRIHPKDDGPAVVEYVQTTTYTEDEDSEPTRVHHVFEWNGSQIQTSTRSAT